MDDCCAVCAEPLEWVAYGPCGHRDVCSTCVVRLRFILNDSRCCICKTPSPSVFVTKAMGEYTKVVSDFSTLPQGPSEGRNGDHWYDEDSQAYFDDADQYRMIKAMCRLSCSVCGDEQEGGGRRRTRFRNIEQLKGHLFHHHRLLMCSLCLEGRKVFMCEQKLYTRTQLNQHIRTGDSEVDGSENERCGFSGHPVCLFCKNPFYGDNELYMHMSREHFTCHICQRRNPGQFDYFKNYDDLEIHFRQEHFICEDEACLAEKFVVFQSESELKRHTAIRHGGNMSRSKRNAALLLPTSFNFRPTSGQGRRGRTFVDYAGNPEPSFAFGQQFTSQMSNATSKNYTSSSSSSSAVSEFREGRQIDAISGSFASLHVAPNVGPSSRSQTTDRQTNAVILEESSFPSLAEREVPETALRYAQALGSSSCSNLGESAFPPLPGASVKHPSEHHGLNNSFAAPIAKNRTRKKLSSNGFQWSGRSDGREPLTSATVASSQAWPSMQSSLSSSSRPSPQTVGIVGHGNVANHVDLFKGNNVSSTSAGKSNRLNHSSSAPDLMLDGNTQLARDIQAANKSLVEKIRSAMGMDADKFSAFKSISAEYRQGLIGASEYVYYAQQFGLSHLILDLAQLCPDPKKQKELTDIYMVNLHHDHSSEKNNIASSSGGSSKSSKKKGKSIETTDNNRATAKLTENILNTVRKLQEDYRSNSKDENIELLSKDGYRTSKGRSLSAPGREQAIAESSPVEDHSASTPSVQESGVANSKQRKKTSKFHRVRLGDGSIVTSRDFAGREDSPEQPMENSSSQGGSKLPHSVWRNGGGQKLFIAPVKGSQT